MDQNQRLLLAFVVSFAVLLTWRMFFLKAPPPPPPARRPPVQKPQPAVPAPPRLSVVRASEAREITVEGGDLYRITLSTRGATVTSWVLKKYLDEKNQPLDVVDRAACETLGYPMSLNLADSILAGELNTALYVATPSAPSLQAPLKMEFVYSDGKIQARKKFSFGPSYQIEVELSVADGPQYLPVEVSWPGGFGDHSLPYAQQSALRQAVYHTTQDLVRVPERKVDEDRSIPGPLDYAGMEDRYFVNILFPGSQDQAFRFGRRALAPTDQKEKDTPKALTAMLGSPLPKPLAFRMFVAPKDIDVLRTASPPLEGLIDFGWFSFIAKPLFLAMRYVYDHWTHNYGWAIILLTIVINLAMFPLKLKSIQSAQKMQRIAPLVKSIQDRYKQYKFNDPRKQRMNQEVMKLYQEHGINPVGGCLPMALQIPFLYGFYNVLNQAIELRHAPWTLWIKDLSAPDRLPVFGYHIPVLVILMIVTTFVLQKMTPMATADPAQQRMMMIMPLFLGVMFYNFASGLVLYWLTGNLVGLAQQTLINRKMPGPQNVQAARRPSEARD